MFRNVEKSVGDDFCVCIRCDLGINVGVGGDNIPSWQNLPSQIQFNASTLLLPSCNWSKSKVWISWGNILFGNVKVCQSRKEFIKQLGFDTNFLPLPLFRFKGIATECVLRVGIKRSRIASVEGHFFNRLINNTQTGSQSIIISSYFTAEDGSTRNIYCFLLYRVIT